MMEIKELGTVCEVIAGQSPPSSSYNQEKIGMPFFQGKADFGMINPTVRYWCTDPKKTSVVGDILFSVRAPVGSTNINNIDACIGRGLSAIRCGSKIDTKYLLHYLRFNEEKIASLGTGSTFKAITIKTLKKLQIPLPPLAEQKRIAAILDEADKIRQLNKKLIEHYEQLSQSLFLEMFGDPVLNPMGWEKVKLENLVSKLGDGLHGTPNYSDSGEYFFVNGNNLRNARIYIDNSTKRVDKAEFEKYKKNLGETSMFVSINGTIGKVAFYNGEKIILGKSACYFNYIPDKVNPIFLYHMINSHYFIRYATKESTGSTIKNVSLKSMRNFPVIMPGLSLQTQFAERVQEIEHQKEQAELSLQKSEELFQSLLQRAFRGEL